jgi:acetyl esterase/lipase
MNLAIFGLVGLLIGSTAVSAQEFTVETRKAVQYGTHDGTALVGDLYLPTATENRPAIVAVHGGGYQLGSRDIYQYMGPYLAAHGYAVFSIDYRLIRDGKNRYPAAVHDTRAAVQWVRSHGAELKIDPARIALRAIPLVLTSARSWHLPVTRRTTLAPIAMTHTPALARR